jgi:hypothetical protein
MSTPAPQQRTLASFFAPKTNKRKNEQTPSAEEPAKVPLQKRRAVMESESDDDPEDAAMDGGAFQAPATDVAGAAPVERQVEQTPSVDAAARKAEQTPVQPAPAVKTEGAASEQTEKTEKTEKTEGTASAPKASAPKAKAPAGAVFSMFQPKPKKEAAAATPKATSPAQTKAEPAKAEPANAEPAEKAKPAAANAAAAGSAVGPGGALGYRKLAAMMNDVDGTTKRLEITAFCRDFVRDLPRDVRL